MTMIVRVLVAVDTKAERKRADDLVEDLKEDRKEDHREEEADHKEVEVDRRAAAAVLDRANLIVLVRASLNNSPLTYKAGVIAWHSGCRVDPADEISFLGCTDR